MRLEEYIKDLERIKKVHGNLELVYSTDDEGNGFFPVHFSPSVGTYEDNEWEDNEETPNAVCVN